MSNSDSNFSLTLTMLLSGRLQVEEAFLYATCKYLDPIGITNRWTNYTAHPSQTPGRFALQRIRPRLGQSPGAIQGSDQWPATGRLESCYPYN